MTSRNVPAGSLAVSVAMTTYNGERYLPEQLASIAAQTVPPAELVVCDDLSTDGTLATVERFAATAGFPVRVFRNEARLGYRHNFRRAVSLCEAPLIAFCDQDDVWYPQKIEVQSRMFCDPAVLLCYHNAEVADDDGTPIGLMHDRLREEEILSRYPSVPFRYTYGLLQMFRSSLCRWDHLWDLSHEPSNISEMAPHDHWFYFLAAAFDGVAYLDEVLLRYRQHQSNHRGAPKQDGLVQRLKFHLTRYGVFDKNMAEEARARSFILRSMAKEPDVDQHRLIRLAEEFDRLSERYGRRSETYSADKATTRLRYLLSALRAGDYSPGVWTFRRPELIRDFWSGVIRRMDHPAGT